MAVRLGGGDYTFEVNENWAEIPDEIVLGDCAAVGVDSKDNVYAFNRGDHPIAVFDKDGTLLRTWGEGVFSRPHGVHVAPDDTIWLTDDGDHTVRHCTLDGKILMELGIPGAFGDERILAAYQTVVDACRANGKFAGVGGIADRELLRRYIGMGVRLVLPGSDLGFMASAASECAAAMRAFL